MTNSEHPEGRSVLNLCRSDFEGHFHLREQSGGFPGTESGGTSRDDQLLPKRKPSAVEGKCVQRRDISWASWESGALRP